MDKIGCPFCGDSAVALFVGTRLSRCSVCGLFINSVFPHHKDELKERCKNQMLRACYKEGKRKGRIADANYQLDTLERHLAPGTVYDIGAAGGFFMKVAERRGWEVHGNEISRKAIAWAKENYDLMIDYGFLEEVDLIEGYYDAVVLWNTLEHTYDPSETLMTSRAILKPGGLIYIKVPNKRTVKALNEHYEVAHLYEFTEECLSQHLEAMGFQRIEREAYNPKAGVPACEYLYKKEGK